MRSNGSINDHANGSAEAGIPWECLIESELPARERRTTSSPSIVPSDVYPLVPLRETVREYAASVSDKLLRSTTGLTGLTSRSAILPGWAQAEHRPDHRALAFGRCVKYSRARGFMDSNYSSFYLANIAVEDGHTTLLSSKPLVACFTRTVGRIVLFLCLTYTATSFYHDVQAWKKDYVVSSRRFRFTAESIRNQDKANSTATRLNLQAFGLMTNGNDIKQPFRAHWTANSATIEFEEDVQINGWFIRTGSADRANDPSKFYVEAIDGYSRWVRIASSAREGNQLLSPQRYRYPWKRGQKLEFDLAPSWQWHCRMTMIDGFGVVHFFFAFTMSLLRMCSEYWPAQWRAYAMCCLTCSIASACTRDTPAMLRGIMTALSDLGLVVGTVWEHRLWQGLLWIAIVNLATATGFLASWYWDPTPKTVYTFFAYGVPCLAFVMVSLIRRYVWRQKLEKLVAEDRQRFNACWESLVANSGLANDLHHLEDAAESLRCAGTKKKVVQQMLAVTERAAAAELMGVQDHSFMVQMRKCCRCRCCCCCRWCCGFGSKWPNRSLTQIFTHAEFMNALLIDKVDEWAAKCSGYQKMDDRATPGHYMYCQPSLATDRDRSRIRRGEVKTLERGMEKVMRCYQGDVSRLVDVCRQSIYFDDVKDITECLRAILLDDSVVVVRCKNRMHPDFDAKDTLGYRDVLVNVRIVSSEALSAGLELHVCEVLLVLKEMANLKNAEGHQRFLRFRNMRS